MDEKDYYCLELDGDLKFSFHKETWIHDNTVSFVYHNNPDFASRIKVY